VIGSTKLSIVMPNNNTNNKMKKLHLTRLILFTIHEIKDNIKNSGIVVTC
jgi:hypothetical protein